MLALLFFAAVFAAPELKVKELSQTLRVAGTPIPTISTRVNRKAKLSEDQKFESSFTAISFEKSRVGGWKVTNATPLVLKEIPVQFDDGSFAVIELNRPIQEFEMAVIQLPQNVKTVSLNQQLQIFNPTLIFNSTQPSRCQTKKTGVCTEFGQSAIERERVEVPVTNIFQAANTKWYADLMKEQFKRRCKVYRECTDPRKAALEGLLQYGATGHRLSLMVLRFRGWSRNGGVGTGRRSDITQNTANTRGRAAIAAFRVKEDSKRLYTKSQYDTWFHEIGHAYGFSHNSGMTYGFSTAFANTLFNKIGNLQMQRAELKIPMIQMSYQKKSPTTMRIFFHTLNVAGKYSVDLTVLTTSEWRFELKPKKSYVDIEFDQAPQSPIFIRAGLNKASAKKDLLSTLRLVPTDF